MATNHLRAESARDNVVRLPTAARRKVHQFWNKTTRAARAALPQHPAEHLFPGQRAARRLAEHLHAMDHTTRNEVVSRLNLTVGERFDLEMAFSRLVRGGR